MSLKTFHIVFVVFSTLLALVFGLWALQRYQQAQSPGMLLTAIGSGVAVVVLLVYGVWFLRKARRLGLM